MTCCDHPRITLRWHTRPDASRGPWWLTCACGAFTDYAPDADAAWRLESALSCPRRGNSPGGSSAAGGLSPEVS